MILQFITINRLSVRVRGTMGRYIFVCRTRAEAHDLYRFLLAA